MKEILFGGCKPLQQACDVSSCHLFREKCELSGEFTVEKDNRSPRKFVERAIDDGPAVLAGDNLPRSGVEVKALPVSGIQQMKR